MGGSEIGRLEDRLKRLEDRVRQLERELAATRASAMVAEGGHVHSLSASPETSISDADRVRLITRVPLLRNVK